MNDVFGPLFGKAGKVRKVAFVVEHRGTGKAARAQFVIKIDVLRILGKIIQPAYNVPALILHCVGKTYELDVVFLYERGIQIASGIC